MRSQGLAALLLACVYFGADERRLLVGEARALGVAAGEHRHVRVRTSFDGVAWSSWRELSTDAEEGTLVWFDSPARRVEVEGAGSAKLLLIDPGVTPRAVVAEGDPAIVGRAQWCPAPFVCPANASPSRTTPTHLVVHHTAGSNSSTDWAAVMRAIWELHVRGNGWADIGYNYLIDPNGVAYEGRGDGILGAHFSGVNTGTAGFSMMGTFTDRAPSSASLTKLRELLAWQAAKYNLDPLGQARHAASGLDLNVISGHRDAGLSPQASGRTECPGVALYPLLPKLRDDVCALSSGCKPRTERANPCAEATTACVPANAIVNSASFDIRPVTAGSIVSVFGTKLSGLRATVNDRAAEILANTAEQINLLIPAATQPGMARLKLLEDSTTRVERLFSVTETAAAFYPVAVNFDEGVLNSAATPVTKGRPLVLYVSGAGIARPWNATLGGRAAGALFLGAAPGFPGVQQCNIEVPADAAPGEQELQITVSGVPSAPLKVFVQ
ncbi:MAG: hypothetical protein FJW38_02550 [Acidobacteria bacterium]|nr:hypothetical protein [Acidobacteriota bacterium]